MYPTLNAIYLCSSTSTRGIWTPSEKESHLLSTFEKDWLTTNHQCCVVIQKTFSAWRKKTFVKLYFQIFIILLQTRTHSSKTRTVHCSGRLSCHAHPSAMHAPPPTHMPPCHTCSLSCTPPPLPRTPLCHACPPPHTHMPPCHTCSLSCTPCYACPHLCHAHSPFITHATPSPLAEGMIHACETLPFRIYCYWR